MAILEDCPSGLCNIKARLMLPASHVQSLRWPQYQKIHSLPSLGLPPSKLQKFRITFPSTGSGDCDWLHQKTWSYQFLLFSGIASRIINPLAALPKDLSVMDVSAGAERRDCVFRHLSSAKRGAEIVSDRANKLHRLKSCLLLSIHGVQLSNWRKFQKIDFSWSFLLSPIETASFFASVSCQRGATIKIDWTCEWYHVKTCSSPPLYKARLMYRERHQKIPLPWSFQLVENHDYALFAMIWSKNGERRYQRTDPVKAIEQRSFFFIIASNTIAWMTAIPKHPFFVLNPAFLPSKRQNFASIFVKWWSCVVKYWDSEQYPVKACSSLLLHQVQSVQRLYFQNITESWIVQPAKPAKKRQFW